MQPGKLKKKIADTKTEIDLSNMEYQKLGQTILILNGKLRAFEELLKDEEEKTNNK